MRIVTHPLANENISEYIDLWENIKEEAEKKYGFCWTTDFGGRHYLNLHAFTITKKEHKAFLEAHKRVIHLFHTIRDRVTENETLLEMLGIPENLWDLVCRQEIPYITAMGRFDWTVDQNGGLKLFEINSETPFGQTEAIFLQKIIAQLYPQYINPNEKLRLRMGKALRESFIRQGGDENSIVAISAFVSDDFEEATTAYNIKRIARYPAARVVYCDVHDMSVTKAGRIAVHPISEKKGGLKDELALIDFNQCWYAIDWLAKDKGGKKYVEALRQGTLKHINPPQTLLYHSKGFFAVAWLLYLAGSLNPLDAETVERYIPLSSFDPETLYGKTTMIKPLHNREGRGIRKAKRMSKKDKVRWAAIYQEFVEAKSFAFPVCYNGRIKETPYKPTIGTFTLNDRFGGYYTRFGNEVVNYYEVSYAPTFILDEQ